MEPTIMQQMEILLSIGNRTSLKWVHIYESNHLSQGFRVGKMAKHHKCLKQLEALIAYLSNRSHVAQPHTAQTSEMMFSEKGI